MQNPQTLLTLALAIERNTAAQCNNRFISLQEASETYFANMPITELIKTLETHGAIFPHSKRSGMVDLITIQRVISRMSTADQNQTKGC